jgi:DNA-binding NarL/FixJ family response regulator
MSKIFIIDDHAVVRQNYVLLLRREPGMEFCGEAASGLEAIRKITETLPDIVVLDVSLQGEMDGIELLQHLHDNFSHLPVLVVSGHDELVYADRILSMGAQGYVMKGDAVAFIQALHQVANGKIYLSDQMRKRQR